jgi:hypothetical protein
MDGNHKLAGEDKPPAARLIVEEPVCGDLVLHRGERATEVDRGQLASAAQVLGHLLEGRRCVHGQPSHCLVSRLWERILVAGNRQQDEEDGLGIAGQLLDDYRAGGVWLELRGLDEALNVRHLLRDEAALCVHLARTETSRLGARERKSG